MWYPSTHTTSSWISIYSSIVLIIALCTTVDATGTGANSTCNRLVGSLGRDVVSSEGSEYDLGATNTWSLFNAGSRPSCIIFPRNARHVQTAMRAIFRDRVRYAVQAGSHSAMPGWNNVDKGVLIHFRHMTDVSYDPVKDTVTLQPGVHWGDAISVLEPHGVAVSGGRLGDIGTGLLLGGGFSYLSPSVGFSADLFEEVDVVLVNGDLVTATANNQYSDLFRALKGGANRFGIVTRYEVTAVHTGMPGEKQWFGGLIVYPGTSSTALLEATARYVRNVEDPNAALLVALTYQPIGGVLTANHLVTLFYRGTSLPPHIFGDFLNTPSLVQMLGPASYAEVVNSLGSGADRGSGQLFGASAFGGDVTQYVNAFDHWTNYSTTFQESTNGTVLAFTPILNTQIRAGRRRGSNAIDPPLGGYAAVQMQTQFPAGVTKVPADVERGRQLLFRQVPRSAGLPLYINECDASQAVFSTYGGYEFLKRTYAKYDPTRFNVRFTDGPIGL